MMSEINVNEVLRETFQQAFNLLEVTMSDVTTEQLHWVPPGNMNPIGATYVHILLSHDGLVNGMLRKKPPIFLTPTWKDNIGLSEMPPMPGPGTQGLPDWSDWARRVQIDMEPLKTYAQALYTDMDEYLASLSSEELHQIVDASNAGMGEMPLVKYLILIILGHANIHCGEICSLKGLQGMNGFPV